MIPRHRLRLPAAITTLAAALLAGCGGGGSDTHVALGGTSDDASFELAIPAGFPAPKASATTSLTAAKVELGRHLFYDFRLSIDQTTACASCHQPARGFSDGRATAIGALGEPHPRNAMGLTNVIYNATFDWANPLLTSLPQQTLTPMFNEFPVELGWSNNEQEILERLQADPAYRQLFAAAFPEQENPYNPDDVAAAIAAFTATFISGNAPYDQAVYQGRAEALSAAAQRGEELFFSERLECFHCHGGFNFSQSVDHAGVTFDQAVFHNNGLYNIGGSGDYPLGNRGLWEFTQRPFDMGRFRAPTLRNIELTAPYMHDGSIATLGEVIDHYARGGRLISDGPLAGDGAENPFKSELLVSFSLTPEERDDLIAFLNSLTDWEFLCRPTLQDPFGNFPPHERCATFAVER